MTLPPDVLRELHTLEREAVVALLSYERPLPDAIKGRPAYSELGYEGGLAHALSVLRPLLEAAYAERVAIE